MNNIVDFNQIRKLKKKDLLEICSNLYITTTGISKDALNILVAHKLGISTTGKAGHFLTRPGSRGLATWPDEWLPTGGFVTTKRQHVFVRKLIRVTTAYCHHQCHWTVYIHARLY